MSRTAWWESENPDRWFWSAGWRALIAIVVLVGLSWGSYLLYLHIVEGPAITQHASNIRHSLNFVQGANQRAESLMPDYASAVAAKDDAHANALRNAICSAAGSISVSERYDDVASFYTTNCGG